MFESTTLTVTCPACSYRNRFAVMRLKLRDVSCGRCQARIDTRPFRDEIRTAEKAIADFEREIGQIKIEIKL